MPLRHLMRVLGRDPKDARNLTQEEAFRAFTSVLTGGESEVTIGAFLTALRWKGVTVEELSGFALAARAQARIPCRGMEGLVCVSAPLDGQDHHPPLEVMAGLIAAGAGAKVLILSDRCVPPRRGLTAANVLEELDLAMTWDPSEAEHWVTQAGFAAVSVSGVLPALLNLRRVRGDVILRTPLSTVEKLLAPAGSAVVLGAQGGPVLGTAVEVIQSLGHPRGIALQGVDGGVVPYLRKRTRGIELCEGHLVPLAVNPQDFGLSCNEEPELPLFGPPEEGYGASDNPALVRAAGQATLRILAGDRGPGRSAVLLAASVMLKAGGQVLSLAEGVGAATSSLEDGAAQGVLDHARKLLQ